MIIERTGAVYTAFQQGPIRSVVVEAKTRQEAAQECLRLIREQQASIIQRQGARRCAP
jgi:hypothetical protein